MPTLLHIIASPREDSGSRRVGEALAAAYADSHDGAEIDTLHLFDDGIPEFLAPEAKAKYAVLGGSEPTGPAEEAWQGVIAVVDRLKAADVIVISTPMWNFSIPYRLKQYIDVLVQPGLTFSYSPDEGYRGQVTGKKALLVMARGGDYGPGGVERRDHQEPYLRMILAFIGITDVQSVVIQPTLMGGQDIAEANAQAAIRRAEGLARQL